MYSAHFGFAVSDSSPVGFVRVLLMRWAAVGAAELLGEGIVKLKYGMLPRSPAPPQVGPNPNANPRLRHHDLG